MAPEGDVPTRLYAHSKPGNGEEEWQVLSDHLKNVGALAASFAERWKAEQWGEAAGLGHDLGKATPDYQDKRLRGAKVRVDHSTRGAQWAEKEFFPLGRILSACIAGHHSGLPDGKSKDESCLASRLKRTLPADLPGEGLPPAAFLPNSLPFELDSRNAVFQLAFFTRMVFSCLVDADFLDTEGFVDPGKASWRGGFPPLEAISQRFREKLDDMLVAAPPTEINRWRKEILGFCLAAAEKCPGMFSLSVPTGGGKTLSSLAFALKHALLHGLERIIYVVPFTSIIEQNAEVFRKYLGTDAVLEHHSAFDADKVVPAGSEQDETLRGFELATENWDAPLIVTTAVQFFESLFGSRPSRCRKIHNIARSVVILDEAQMLPVPFLMPCIEALREIALHYGTTVVLCTATQPAVMESEEFRRGLAGVREIMPDPPGLHERFRGVAFKNLGALSPDGVADLLRQNPRILCVVNTRPEAREVFRRIKDEVGAYHLSALMCPEHRSRILEEIRQRLKDGLPCRLVSTRLIEAGVDVDFPVVMRAVSGIDSIVQAAGRCNRERNPGTVGRVLVFEFEGRLPPGNFRAPAETAREIMRKHSDPLSPAAVEDYFRLLYWRAETTWGKGGLDRELILDSLKPNCRELFFPFREIAEKFRLIREDGEAVLIPFDDKARKCIAALRGAEFPGSVLRSLQRYSVQVPRRKLMELEDAGVVERIQGVYAALKAEAAEQYYRMDTGLVLIEQLGEDEEGFVV
ncbi:MAG: CRISPR-associated helicase Cas3' [Syntrophobacteraceae bacterium]